jgi:hypothetical protein
MGKLRELNKTKLTGTDWECGCQERGLTLDVLIILCDVRNRA